jgi:hypothetical protein
MRATRAEVLGTSFLVGTICAWIISAIVFTLEPAIFGHLSVILGVLSNVAWLLAMIAVTVVVFRRQRPT